MDRQESLRNEIGYGGPGLLQGASVKRLSFLTLTNGTLISCRFDADFWRRVCPMMDYLISTHSPKSDHFCVCTTLKAYDAAVKIISGAQIQDLALKENEVIDLYLFAKLYEIERLDEVSKNFCIDHFDFNKMDAMNLLKIQFLFFDLFYVRDDKEDILLEAISQRGAEVLKSIQLFELPCLNTVKRILSLPSLNVFSEKSVFDSIIHWSENIIRLHPSASDFKTRFENEILPLIRFDFFTIDEMNDFLDNYIISADLTKKITLIRNNKIATSKWDDTAEKSHRVPVLALPKRDFSEKGGLNFKYFSEWRGRFIPFTERTVVLKLTEEKSASDRLFEIRPLMRDLYLLNVMPFDLNYCNQNYAKITYMIVVIRTGDGTIVSEITFKWNNDETNLCQFLNPCLLEKGQSYRIALMNCQNFDGIQFAPCFEADPNDTKYGDIISVTGRGNICTFEFAFAKETGVGKH